MPASQVSVAVVQDPATAAQVESVASMLGGVPKAFDSLTEVSQAIQKEEARFAVVTAENSAAGTALSVYDLILAYGLRIVAEHFKSMPDSTARFLVLAKAQQSWISLAESTSGSLKTTLTVSSPMSGGSKSSKLHRLMDVFVTRAVELVKIESQKFLSAESEHDGLMVHADVVGNESDESIVGALADLRELTHNVRVLGSYHAASENGKDSSEGDGSFVPPESKETSTAVQKYPLNPVVTDLPLDAKLVIFGLAKQMEASGVTAHSMCIGGTDFAPPDCVIEARIRALKRRNVRYSQLRGEPSLRQLIARYLSTVKGVTYDPNTEIQVTAGAQQALYHALYTLICPGDKVVLPSPSWAAYEAIITQVRADLVRLRGKPEGDYLINPQALEDALTANPTAKVLMLCNPSNPAGTLHLPHHLERIAEVLRKPQFSHVVVIADEIYEQIVYQDEGHPKRVHQCFATLPGMRERTFIINGFSKAYAMAGLRIGFIAAPSYFVGPCMVLQGHFTSTASTIGQLAAAEALRGELELFEQGKSRVAPELEKLNAKRQYITRRLRAIPNIKFAYPTAAFYLFMDLSAYFEGKRAFATRSHGASVAKEQAEVIHDVADFCEFMLREYHVALSPGVDFGEDFGVRISYAAKMETVAHGMDALEHALHSLTFESA